MSDENTTNEDSLEGDFASNHKTENGEEKENSELGDTTFISGFYNCLLYTSPSPRDATLSRMPSSA